MNHFFHNFSSILHATVGDTLYKVVNFLPNLLSALLILVFGWVIAILLAHVVERVFLSLRLDSLAERRGLVRTLGDVGIDIPPSRIAREFVFWLLLLLMLEPLTQALRLAYLSAVVARLLSFVPSVIAAAAILLLGLSFARIVGGSVARTAKAAGLEYAGVLGTLTRYFLALIVVIITLAQLGIQTAILTVIFAVILLSVGVASAMAFGTEARQWSPTSWQGLSFGTTSLREEISRFRESRGPSCLSIPLVLLWTAMVVKLLCPTRS